MWALALSRLLHEKELLIDHTVNLRGKEYHDLFGVFVNDLPIRYNFVMAKHHYRANSFCE